MSLLCLIVVMFLHSTLFCFSTSDKDATVILLLFNADPVNITWAVDTDAVDAIIECYYPAQSTGVALYNVLTGVVSPGGRLPYTWPASLDQVMADPRGQWCNVVLGQDKGDCKNWPLCYLISHGFPKT